MFSKIDKIVPLAIFCLLLGYTNLSADEQIGFTSSNLPIVIIDTHGQSIIDAEKIDAHMGIIDNGSGMRNNVTDSFNDYDGKIGIETRGSSSQMFPKKQYALETRLENGENNSVSLLGLPPENDWILYAPYTDKSMMRNVLAYDLSNQIGRYASRTRYCEVVINGDYKGIYVLLEKIKRDKNRVNIARLDPQEISGLDLSGGYIIKIDKRDGENIAGWYSPFPPYAGATEQIYYQYHYPKPDEISPEQKEYIQDFISDFELTMFGVEYADLFRGYPRYIDDHSFIDHFILNEIGKNVDGYRLSAFMYKDRNDKNEKMFMGPIWDFNLAFGNADYYNGQYTYGWQADFKGYGDSFQIPFWWLKLRADKTFAERLLLRWSELRQSTLSDEHMLAMIDSIAFLLDEAKERDFERWPRLGTYVWPNPYVFETYEQEVAYLKSWIEDRNDWIDENFFEQVQPSAPTALKLVSKTSSTASLSWKSGADNKLIAAYDICHGGVLLQSTPYTSTIIKNLDENTIYHFTVNSRDYAGNISLNNPTISCTTDVFAPEDGYLALKTAEKPVIDGISEQLWQACPAAELNNVVSGFVENEQDLSAEYKLCWDEQNLFVFVQITDNVRMDDSGTSISDDDGIELYVDLDNSKNTSYGVDDFKYRFAYNDSMVYERIHNAVQGVNFAMVPTDDGYLTEISFPWTTFGIPPRDNYLIGFEIQVNDDDDGGARDAKIAWWGMEDNAHQNPSAFGTIKLKNAVSHLAADTPYPEKFYLSQNFPNPFNPVTRIEYHLPFPCQVDLTIYNLLGQRVATLVSGTKSAGIYSVAWDVSGLNRKASGLYFYRFTTSSGFSETKRMLLLK